MDIHRAYLVKHGFEDKDATATAYANSVKDERHDRNTEWCCYLFGFIPCISVSFTDIKKDVILPSH
jgi:hypothetical protein